MSLIKLSLAGNNEIITGQGEFVSYIPAGEGKIDNLFYSIDKSDPDSRRLFESIFFPAVVRQYPYPPS